MIRTLILSALIIGASLSPLACLSSAQKTAAKDAAIACAYSDALGLIGEVTKDVNATDPGSALAASAVVVGEDALACAVKVWVAVQNASKPTPSTSQPTKGQVAAEAFIANKTFK